MRRLLAAAAAGLMTLSALPAAAAAVPQEHRYDQDHSNRGRTDNNWNNGRDDDRYGRWDDGSAPARTVRRVAGRDRTTGTATSAPVRCAIAATIRAPTPSSCVAASSPAVDCRSPATGR